MSFGARVDASRLGFHSDRLAEAVAFAEANESQMDRDIGKALEAGHFEEPWPIGQTIGPVKPRGGPTGIILRHGQTAARWGETDRVDMSFSISKSYLALLAGIAVADGLIPDLHAPVRDLVTDGGFDSAQNQSITWAHLLWLTSEWEGTLWDKPDWIDHYRDLSRTGTRPAIGTKRPLQAPGTYWEYNDVRVNRLALSLLRVFKRPLRDVLRDRIMVPIGATSAWEWHGYENSWIDVNGKTMQSVSGGAHWGGGLWISAEDHARVGQLMLQNGRWAENQLLPADWIAFCQTPCPLNPQYGALWWLNSDGTLYPSAPRASYAAMGVGSQIIWVDPSRELVVVARWLDAAIVPDFVARVSAAAA